MRRIFTLPLVLALSAALPLSGQCCDPCGQFEIGGEFLWLQPSTCPNGTTIQDPRPFESITTSDERLPVGRQRPSGVDYESGFRVLVGYVFDCGCSDIELQYTRLHTYDKSEILPKPGGTGANPSRGGGLWPVLGHPRYLSGALYNAGTTTTLNQADAVVRGQNNFGYDAVNLEFASRFMCSGRAWVRGGIGVGFAHIDNRVSVSYLGTQNPDTGSAVGQTQIVDANIRTASSTWGVGPRLVVDARYDLRCGFGLSARGAWHILAGSSHTTYKEDVVITGGTTTTPDVTVDQSSNVKFCLDKIVIPAFNSRLGVNYTLCAVGCLSAVFEVGYEFISYLGALPNVQFVDRASAQVESCYNFNLDGMYAMVELLF